MTTQAAAVEAIYERWAAQTSISATDYCFDNEEFDPQTKTAWARVQVQHSVSVQTTIGPTSHRVFQRRGVIVVQLHAKHNVGRASIDALVDATRVIFEGANFSGIICPGRCTARELGIVGHWFQVNVEAAFYFEQER